jgi:hypothetical protein
VAAVDLLAPECFGDLRDPDPNAARKKALESAPQFTLCCYLSAI